MKCSKCQWWIPNMDRNEEWGECRKNPPKPIVVAGGEDPWPGADVYWPETRLEDFCSEFIGVPEDVF